MLARNIFKEEMFLVQAGTLPDRWSRFNWRYIFLSDMAKVY